MKQADVIMSLLIMDVS